MKITRKNKIMYLVMLLLLAAFLILKMRRGFTVSDDQGGIWNIIQGFFVLCGLFVLFSKENTYKEFPFVKLYVAFMLIIWFLSLFVFVFRKFGVSTLFHFLTVPYGAMVVLAFYYVGLRCDIKKYPIILWTAYLIIFYILFTSIRIVLLIPGFDMGAVADVYYIVGLLPLLFIYTPQKLRMIPFFIACVAVMMTGKRAGFIALGVIMIFYFLFGSGEETKFSLLKRLFAFAIVLGGTYFLIAKLTGLFNLRMFDRLSTLEEDGGSGRASRWTHIITADQSIIKMLVGHGYGGVVKLVGGHAHNDFLEMFYDYGIFAVILYIAVFVAYFREMLSMYKAKFPYAKEFMVSFVVSLFLAMFSFYAIDCTHITCCSVCIGLILAEWYKFKHDIINYE